MIKRYTIICLMALIILFVIHLFIIKLNYASESFVTPQPFAESSLIQGLYSPKDKVFILTADNFNQNVYGSDSSWLVQFYNSWCGHCIKFSPVWKQFGADVQNWQSIVRVGVVNCAADENTQHCREYDIMGYPTIRFFQPRTTNTTTLGTDLIPASRDDAEKLRQGFLVTLESTTLEKPVENWPVLSPIHKHDIDLVLADKKTVEFLLIVEEDTSYVGRDLIMDMNKLSWLTTRRILRKDYPTNESFQLFAVTKKAFTNVPVPDQSRISVFEAVRNFYKGKGYDIADLSLKTEEKSDSHRKSAGQTMKQKTMVHTLFQEDLNSALIFSLGHEIPLKAHIEKEAFTALVNYLSVIKKYFPFSSKDEAFPENLLHDLSARTSVTGGDFKKLVDQYGKDFMQQPKEWVGCEGSDSKFRGYTCGLWMLFHTLTVRRYPKETSPPAKEILSTMTDYIKNFFGCHDCAEHFIAMSTTIDGNVTTVPDDLLWLWKAHNTVNRRLAGDKSEDPVFPKQQFPHPEVCSRCRLTDTTWNESAVLEFLINMYSHPKTKNTTSEISAEKLIDKIDEKEGSWNLRQSLTDVNACIGLYMLSACLLTVYTIRLFIKRSPRFTKHYKYDYSSRA